MQKKKKKKNTTGAYIMRRLETLTQVWIPKHHRFNVSSKGAHLYRTGSKGMLCNKKSKLKPVTGLCPAQKVKAMNKNGNFTEALAMLDSWPNTSLFSKSAADRFDLKGSARHLTSHHHLTMNLAGGKKKTEPSQVIDITVASPTGEDITKTLLRVHPNQTFQLCQNNFYRVIGRIQPFEERFR